MWTRKCQVNANVNIHSFNFNINKQKKQTIRSKFKKNIETKCLIL